MFNHKLALLAHVLGFPSLSPQGNASFQLENITFI